jgi:radical SAM superfamily enzyme YgiQ (UPF0313 family)
MTKPVKILLIAPQSTLPRKLPILIPMGLLSIGGFLRKYGFEVRVYNAGFISSDFSSDTIINVKSILKNYSPDILGLGFPTDALQSAIDTARTAKEINKQIIIIVGGIHPTAMPEQTLKTPYFDYLVHGEGEITFLELVEAIHNKSDLVNVKGIAFKKNSRIIVTDARPEITNLDDVPYNNRDLLIGIENYPKTALGQIHTSRGCNYSCAYCSSPIIWKKKVRFRSVKNVVEEIIYLYSTYQIRDYNFADDNFTLDPERMQAICRGILDKRLKIHWQCCARADIHRQFDLAALKLMRRAGCQNLCIGFESGSQAILDHAKRGINIAETEALMKMIKNAGIKLHADFIIGLPGENKMTLNQTFEMMKNVWKKNHATISVAIFKSYPGTATFKQKVLPDYKELHNQFREIFKYAETCNIKSLSGNTRFLKNRITEAISSPKELKSLFIKTVKAWISKND